MNLEDLTDICLKFGGVTTDIKWENHLCFNIGDKMFHISSLDNVPITASFKVTNEDFEELITRDGFQAAAYLGQYKWVSVDDISRLSNEQWKQYAFKSYSLIGAKLSKKRRTELNFEG